MARTKILYVDHHPLMGGAERSLLYLLKHLDRTRFEPILVSAQASPLAQQARDFNVRVEPVVLDRLRGIRNPAVAVRVLRRGVGELLSLIKTEKIAIVHSNVMRASIYSAVAAKMGGARLIWHVRDIHHEQLYMNIMSRAADRIIAISNAVAETLPPSARSKATVIYNGVDLEEFDLQQTRGQFRRTLGIGENTLLFGSIAWIAPWKQQHLFLEAAAKVAPRNPDAVFVLVGGLADERHAGYFQELQLLAQRELKDRAIFAGSVIQTAEAMADIDVLVHTADAEPFGRVLVEAMALAKPVIAPDSGGPGEIVEHNRTGILVPAGDVSALAESMLLLGSDREKAREMGLAGRRRVEAMFDARKHAREVEQVYDQILAHCRRR